MLSWVASYSWPWTRLYLVLDLTIKRVPLSPSKGLLWNRWSPHHILFFFFWLFLLCFSSVYCFTVNSLVVYKVYRCELLMPGLRSLYWTGCLKFHWLLWRAGRKSGEQKGQSPMPFTLTASPLPRPTMRSHTGFVLCLSLVFSKSWVETWTSLGTSEVVLFCFEMTPESWSERMGQVRKGKK